jgi:hypothetical protein
MSRRPTARSVCLRQAGPRNKSRGHAVTAYGVTMLNQKSKLSRYESISSSLA